MKLKNERSRFKMYTIRVVFQPGNVKLIKHFILHRKSFLRIKIYYLYLHKPIHDSFCSESKNI